ncbi:MAG: hypothetical protein COT85_03925 [Chlamydiae bacterium CG10_big_fil_rev_8_21_14_0_10_42_34]|nr:MAG: hypothetical protein COT85_03925 [Chlamydiae bacterium CG10_big_fil_rev_8_21_14_0_10_42_34]
MLLVLAIALEIFFDCIPDGTPVEQFFPSVELAKTELTEKGWELSHFEKKAENTWVFWNLGPRLTDFDFASHPKDQLVLFTWEPPTVQAELFDPKVQAQFGKIFTWDDDLVDNERFFKFHYPVLKGRIEKIPPFEEKKFCTLIARRLCSKHPKQLYKEREVAIRFFEDKKGEFDLFGFGWEKRKFKNFRGSVENKIDVLKNYKFSICYENTRDVKGYITEKIFDCFAAGVVPVYWGASNVTDYIPADCFIDRRKFKDMKQLYKFLKKMKKEEYNRYLQNAEAFLNSEKAKVFTSDHFAKTFLKIVDTVQKPSS